jgi:hypothetical protein
LEEDVKEGDVEEREREHEKEEGGGVGHWEIDGPR